MFVFKRFAAVCVHRVVVRGYGNFAAAYRNNVARFYAFRGIIAFIDIAVVKTALSAALTVTLRWVRGRRAEKPKEQ